MGLCECFLKVTVAVFGNTDEGGFLSGFVSWPLSVITEQFCIAPYKLQNEIRGGKSLTKFHLFTVSFFKLYVEYIDYR